MNQDGVRSTVYWVFEDLKFKISEGYDRNWCFPDSAQLAISAKLTQLTWKTPIIIRSTVKLNSTYVIQKAFANLYRYVPKNVNRIAKPLLVV